MRLSNALDSFFADHTWTTTGMTLTTKRRRFLSVGNSWRRPWLRRGRSWVSPRPCSSFPGTPTRSRTGWWRNCSWSTTGQDWWTPQTFRYQTINPSLLLHIFTDSQRFQNTAKRFAKFPRTWAAPLFAVIVVAKERCTQILATVNR